MDAVLPAGGAVIYLGSTIHFAGSNTTAHEWRRGVHLSFTLGWLRTEENNVLAVPPAIARGLSPEAQALLGYAVHDAIHDGGGYLGMVKMRDPMDLLGEGSLDHGLVTPAVDPVAGAVRPPGVRSGSWVTRVTRSWCSSSRPPTSRPPGSASASATSPRRSQPTTAPLRWCSSSTTATPARPRRPTCTRAVTTPRLVASGVPADALPEGDAAFAVTRRVIKARDRGRDGARTPGFTVICPSVRFDFLTHDQFDAHWRDNHSKVHVASSPGTVHYEQLIIDDALTPGAPQWDGVGLLSFGSAQDYTERLFDGERASKPSSKT